MDARGITEAELIEGARRGAVDEFAAEALAADIRRRENLVKYLLILNGNDPETIWNGLRFGSAALSRGHEASAFLLGAAVEIEHLGNERFDVEKLLLRFDELAASC